MELFQAVDTSLSFTENPKNRGSLGPSAAQIEGLQTPDAALRHELLTILAHEFKTPLQLVLNHLEALEDLAASLSEEASAACALEGMRQGYDRLAARMQDVLDAARMAGGPCPLRLETCCLQTLVRDVFTLMQPRFSAYGLTLELDLDAPIPAVRADEDRIAEVFTRLLENAAQASLPGSRVRVRSLLLPGFTGLAIEDAAEVTVAAEASGVFEAFSRAGHGEVGLGLSLFICKGIVAAHEGRIGVRAKACGGNVFWFVLPTGER